MPSIEIKLAGKVLEKVVLTEERTRIGRSPDNDIVLKNPAVSKSHAVIESTPEGTIIRDLGSINGTFVNELPISEETLKNGDLITIAKYDLIYLEELKKPAQAATPPVDLDSTMILDTRKQKEMLQKAKEAQKITSEAKTSVLLGVRNTNIGEYPLTEQVVTIGKADTCDIKIKGLFLSPVQATITRDGDDYYLTNIGKPGKTRLDGEVVTKTRIRPNSMIEIGKTLFRFLRG